MMDATAEALSVERTLEIAARPETVWELLTDPAEAVRWMGIAAEFDLRPGGAYRVQVVSVDDVATGEFVEIDPPRRLVYTFGWEAGVSEVAPGSSRVEFDLEPSGGGTLLHFRHSGLPSAAAVVSHGHGWDHYLERLRAVGAGEDPGVDPWIAAPPRAS